MAVHSESHDIHRTRCSNSLFLCLTSCAQLPLLTGQRCHVFICAPDLVCVRRSRFPPTAGYITLHAHSRHGPPYPDTQSLDIYNHGLSR
jgi:hypothetical protein